MTQPQGAHLVGSVNFDDAETTIRRAAGILGDRLKRIPDGECGPRFHWIMFQPDVLGQAEGVERVGDEPRMLRMLDARPLRVTDGVDPASIKFPPLGYAAAAEESYAVFRRLRDEGVVPEGTRFQVSLPTPLAVVGAFFPEDQRAAIEPVYRSAMYRELDEILAAIPHEDLAIQWDNAVEFGMIEGVSAKPWWEGDAWEGLAARSAEQADRVPADVEVGFHLCYGDVAEKHFVEPKDAANLVRFANMLVAASTRGIDWIHLPVPIERDDDAYFVPLDGLQIGDAELYLGLVHREDGAEGAQRRIDVARKHVPVFGVATECGIGRAPEGTTDDILRTHAAVAAAW
ncbi:hypothetical protein PU630_01355 [Microbacterium horticulturae]|uniref:5-methyltetrahydropteroyltriglutamate--homocysteine methyltransferase n=1 Tax=Microbacterium horticulturae TaxID=3028316 RepID=A0ABY8BYF4_9MICO|nr:hypothetical protein [Microbacterium sp. KACC 23027]WEG09236.1 hypothetical protein PU630_01355 [Microbacterium sp. KACC 23027]